MRLRVNYRVEANDSPTVYQAIVRLMPGAGQPPAYIPDGTTNQSVESLAKKWFALYVGGLRAG